MKKLIALVVFLAPLILSQSHNISKDFNWGTLYRDSVRYTNLATLTPVRDSIHVVNTDYAYGHGKFILMASSDTDSIKLSGGVINYSTYGVAVDTTYTDEVVLRDSSWNIVSRAVSNTATNKAYTIFPLSQLLKIELVNYRGSSPTRSANYRLELFKNAR